MSRGERINSGAGDGEEKKKKKSETPVQRPIPPTDNQGQKLLWADGGAARRNSTVSSESHLETGHRRSDQRHPDSFKNFYF